jgi:hypothetical protein
LVSTHVHEARLERFREVGQIFNNGMALREFIDMERNDLLPQTVQYVTVGFFEQGLDSGTVDSPGPNPCGVIINTGNRAGSHGQVPCFRS